MFEKEAEEYTDKYDIMNADLSPKSPRHIVLDVFKAGAAFGYNKAIVEIKDAYEGNGNFSAWFENYLEGKNV
jgi:hypothetical protein